MGQRRGVVGEVPARRSDEVGGIGVQAIGPLAVAGPEAGEWLQQATLAIRARVALDVLLDTIQPFPTFSETYLAALKALQSEITAAPQPVVADSPSTNEMSP